MIFPCFATEHAAAERQVFTSAVVRHICVVAVNVYEVPEGVRVACAESEVRAVVVIVAASVQEPRDRPVVRAADTDRKLVVVVVVARAVP